MADQKVDALIHVTINGATATSQTPAEASDSASALATVMYERWCAAVVADLRSESAWMVEMSQSLHRTARLVGPWYVIG